jgi:hypothetical protein
MNEILKSKALRRNFWITMACILSALLLVRFWIGHIDQTSGTLIAITARIVEGLFSSLLTASLVGAFLFYLTPESADPRQIEILPPRDISPAFDEALRNASSWKFKGEFGRYFRTATIPRLSERATSQHKTISVVGLIMDPRNWDLCQRHAEYRNSVTTVDRQNNWTTELVQDQLYATILVTLVFQARNTLLDIELYLLNNFVPARIDLSSGGAIITKEDRKAPALRVRPGSFFFDSYDQEISVTKRQAHRVASSQVRCTIDTIEPAEAETILKEAALWDGASLDGERLQRICDLVKGKHNPYD